MPALPAEPRRRPLARPALAVLLAGLLLSALATGLQVQRNRAEAEARLDALAHRVADRLIDRMLNYEYGLRGTRGMVLAVDPQRLDRAAFQRYQFSRDLAREFPGAHGFGYIRRVPAAAQAGFEAAAAADGWPGFRVRQLVPHPGPRYVIQYIEPVQPNRDAVGLDIASEPNRRQAAEQALRTGAATLTAPITLVQATGQPRRGFLLLLPVYRDDAPLADAAQREAALLGWSYAPLVIDVVLQGVDLSSESLALALRDAPGEAPFHASADLARAGAGGLVRTLQRPLFGRTWQIELRARPRFVAELNQVSPASVALLGALASALVAALVQLRALGQRRARQARAAQARLVRIAENSSDAIVSQTLDGVVTGWNRAAEQLFGWPAAQAIGRPLAELVLQPGQADEALARLRRDAGTEALPPLDTVHRRRDGSLVDVSVATAPITDDEGRVVGVGKTLRDIGARRALERQLQAFNTLLERQVSERTAQLEAARHDLRTILDAMPSMVGYWDRQGVNRFANQAYQRWFGVDPGTLPGRTLPQLLGPALYERNRPYVEGALRGEPQTFERSIPGPDGVLRHSLAHYLPDVVDGEVRGFYALVHDVTELTENRMRLAAAKDELALERQRLENILRGTNVGTWEWNVQTGETRFNERWAEIIGWRLDELAPTSIATWTAHAHPDDLTQSQQQLERHWRGELAHYECECRMRHRDGHWVWVLDRGRVFTWTADGRPEWMYGTHQDISRAKDDLRRLADSEAFLERAGRVARVGGWQLDLATQALSWTSETRRIHEVPDDFQPTLDAAIGFCPPAARALVTQVLQRAMAQGEPWDLELPLTTARGNARWLRAVGEVEYEPGSQPPRPLRLIGAVQDITARREADEALRRLKAAEAANTAKSLFLANLSHEIRTPLNAVINLSHLLGRSPLDAGQRRTLDQVQRAGRALLGLINDVLDLSKIEAGEMALEDAAFDLDTLLDELRDLLQPQAEAQRLALTLDRDADVPTALRGDAHRLRQLLTNLLGNALKFTPAGAVALQVARLPGAAAADDGDAPVTLRFAVHDTGIGIAPEALQRLFKPFSQADASTTRRFGGTGLGLSIVRQLVELMGGEIAVHSQPGQGSRFEITLPLRRAGAADRRDGARADDAPLDPALRWLPGVRVLVVDDSEVNREVAQRILAHEGAHVSGCADGAEALAWLRRAPTDADLVLMDLQMPEMDGVEATRRLRQDPALARLPVVALTAGVLVTERERALAAGMDDFVGKPLSPAALVRVVRRHVERSRGEPLPPRPREAAAAPDADAAPGPAAEPPPAAWPALDGIDARAAAERLGGDPALFARLLDRLLRENATLLAGAGQETGETAGTTQAEGAAPATGAARRAALARALHRLRGGAGMLGAIALQQAATAAEAALADADAADADATDAATAGLAAVAAALQHLQDQADRLQPWLPPPAAAAATAAQPPEASAVAELRGLLQQQDLAARACFARLSAGLRARLGEARHAELAEAIAALDFARAAGLLPP